jgi:sirohydrochlorin ferrochelatase
MHEPPRRVPDDAAIGLLLIDHGSREPAANESLSALATRLRALGRYRTVRHAHMELAAPTIEAGFAELVADGVTDIVVLPYFLAPGRHASRDVPDLCDRAARPYPAVTWALADPVGTSDLMIEAVADCIDRARSRS